MQPTVKMPQVSFVAAKLKEARSAAGFSTHAAAEAVEKRFPGLKLSHSSIANYEKSAKVPAVDIVAALAMVYERQIGWFFEPSIPLTGVRYRLLSSKSGVKDRHQYEHQAQYWLEAYIKLENRLNKPLSRKAKELDGVSKMSARDAARMVRKEFGLKDIDPVPSVIDILEGFGVRTIELPTQLSIDGFAARLGSEPVVILNPSSANDRCRLNAGHELGHVLFGDCDSGQPTTREMDNRAFEFASFLLISREHLKKAFDGRSAVRLVQYKNRYGISMAAMIFRAEKEGILTARETKQLWIKFSRHGWRAKEPGAVREDRAIRFERLLDEAISRKKLTWIEAAAITGIKQDQLRERRDLAMGIVREDEEAPVLKMQG